MSLSSPCHCEDLGKQAHSFGGERAGSEPLCILPKGSTTELTSLNFVLSNPFATFHFETGSSKLSELALYSLCSPGRP